jgi:hypothetical protein
LTRARRRPRHGAPAPHRGGACPARAPWTTACRTSCGGVENLRRNAAPRHFPFVAAHPAIGVFPT